MKTLLLSALLLLPCAAKAGTQATGQSIAFNIDSSTGNALNQLGSFVWAKSIDGITESSSCLVAVQSMNTNANGAWFTTSSDTGTLTFTSTTTVLAQIGTQLIPGVLLERCAPGAFCRVGIFGIYRVPVGSSTSNQYAAFSATRCGIGPDNAFDAAAAALILSGNATAGQSAWIRLR